MITIENLEIYLEVDGDDDEATFARLFEQFIQQWSQRDRARQVEDRQDAVDRRLDGDPEEGW